jgi:hypothetical protein
MLGEVQIAPFCAPQRIDAEIPDAAHSGGSRATVVTSRRHVARLAVQSMSDPADYVQRENCG